MPPWPICSSRRYPAIREPDEKPARNPTPPDASSPITPPGPRGRTTGQRRVLGLPGKWNTGIRIHKVAHGSPLVVAHLGRGTDYRGRMPPKLALLQQSRPDLPGGWFTAAATSLPALLAQ